MSSIQETLRDQGFRLTKNEGGVRYAKRVGDYTIPIDFLTDVPPNTHGTAMVDDIVANILPGINRALLTARNVTITGMDLTGVQQNLILRVCEVGPFLAMKLRAFASREQGKDAFDILYSLLHYDRGTEAAVSSFVEEVRADNAACPDALRCLELHFGSENSLAPRKAADFFPGPVSSNDLSDAGAATAHSAGNGQCGQFTQSRTARLRNSTHRVIPRPSVGVPRLGSPI